MTNEDISVSRNDKIAQLKEKIRFLQAQVNQQIAELFREGMQDIFSNNPNLYIVHWRQYMPTGWNDGDPNYFRISEVFVNLQDEFGYLNEPYSFDEMTNGYLSEDEAEDFNPATNGVSFGPHQPRGRKFIESRLEAHYGDLDEFFEREELEIPEEESEMFAEIYEFFSHFDGDDLKAVFGSDKEIIITRQGIEVFHYQCE